MIFVVYLYLVVLYLYLYSYLYLYLYFFAFAAFLFVQSYEFRPNWQAVFVLLRAANMIFVVYLYLHYSCNLPAGKIGKRGLFYFELRTCFVFVFVFVFGCFVSCLYVTVFAILWFPAGQIGGVVDGSRISSIPAAESCKPCIETKLKRLRNTPIAWGYLLQSCEEKNCKIGGLICARFQSIYQYTNTK